MAENKVNPENYIVIPGWAVSELHLKGNELLIFSIIYGFSQAEEQAFTGSLQYLAEWTNSTKQTVLNCLDKLAQGGLILKEACACNGTKICKYKAVKNFEYYSKNLNGGSQNFLTGYSKNLNGGSQKILPNNIDIYTSDNINDILSTSARFIPPTVEDVQAYCQERRNNVDPQKFVDYYTSNGWKVGRTAMKDWKAAVRTWEKNGYSKGKSAGDLSDGGKWCV